MKGIRGMFYKLIGVIGIMAIPATAIAATLPSGVSASNNGQGAGMILQNAGGFMDQLGWFAIGGAGLIGLFLLFAGLVKVNKHFKQQGGQQESVMGPVVMVIVGIALMSLVLIKGAATTTIFGTNNATQFNQSKGGGASTGVGF